MKVFEEIFQYREMIANLVHKDLRAKYKGSVLGFLWTFLNPLLQLLVYTLVFSVILRAGIDKYYLFLFVALIPWMFFSNCISGGSAVIINEQNLVTKIYFRFSFSAWRHESKIYFMAEYVFPDPVGISISISPLLASLSANLSITLYISIYPYRL